VKATSVPLSRVADVPVTRGSHRVRRGSAISSFAERVRGRRLELGLTRVALAGLAGIAPDTLFQVERGRHEPRAYTLAALAAALETTMDALWHGA
jgi:DNA-binding XRE family transcriptional regulator